MRILHLLASPFWSGPAENVALLAQAQRALGHEVTVAVDRKRRDIAAEEPAVPRFQSLGLLDEGGLALSVKSLPWELWSDLRALRRRQVDVLHAHFTHDHLLARWGTPKGAVRIRSIHAPRSLRASLPEAGAYTVPASHLKAKLEGRHRPVQLLPALVDPMFQPAKDRKALRRTLGLEDTHLVGMISTFQESRRHALGVEAFGAFARQRPQARLVLVGDGALLEATRAQVAERGLEGQVTFAGYQQGPAFAKWLQALDEVWILGLGNDWSARAAAQARACGVRVVAVKEGALPDLTDAQVEAPTVDAVLAAAVSGASARTEHPTNERIASDILDLYRQAAELRR
ncbi:glycosyltransferase [Corallococcus praedator]|uniref:Glycosyltransferase n=1 Tax=Corallococcus praedator TaxID=2316724 RepID=A0ABX9QCC3_9BACT|nr:MULTISPECIES: glycosyltransferase [Corallococcus]RKH23363.1 glycosyltransferase [Corallococcus sp. CA031C]RKI01133.1 glycosyltransferase [Corallococcus praedator]